MPGFFISKADQNGARISAADRELTPGPGKVEYPHEPAGDLLNTVDGRVIQQQPIKDGRLRAWVWRGYPGWLQTYKSLWLALEPLRSRYRKEYGAATPYIYVKEDVTEELKRLVTYTGTATAASGTTLTDTTQNWTTNALIGYELEIVQGLGAGQIRTVASNTATVLTLTLPWSVQPDTSSKYVVRGKVSDWFRARAIEVSRSVMSERLLTYEETRFVFVIDDPSFNYFG